MPKLTTVIGLVLILALGLVTTVRRPEPARAATGDNLVLVWNEETLEAIRKLPPAPTVAARALAIVHTAIYDAWAAYDPLAVGTRLGAGLRQPEAERIQANKDKAISFAAYTALMDLFPARQSFFDQQMAGLGYATDGSDLSAVPAGAMPMAYPMPVYQPPVSTNSLARASLVLGVAEFFTMGLTAIPAIICGHMAKREMRQTGQRGDGLATSGLVLGYMAVIFWGILIVLSIVGAVISATGTGG